MRAIRAGAAAAVVLLGPLAGCAATDYTEHNFETLSEAAEVIDWDCHESRTTAEDDLARFGMHGTACGDGAIYIWESDAKRSDIQSKPSNALEAGWCRLDGGNWTVYGPQYRLEEAEAAIGGTKTCA